MNAIEFDHVSKQYRLGLVSTKTLSHDIRRFWITNILGKEDPYLKIGETNDRASKGSSEYVWALRDINFNVEQGDVVGIIGKNGAGKSTLLKLLSRVTGPTTGQIRAHGRIGSLLEVGTGFHSEMTGRENIFMNGAILGMSRAEIQSKLDEIVDFSGCERYIDTPVKRYSSGMMVRLGFAVAAHLDPEILVVDEVLAVGDAEFQKKAIGKMQDVSKGEGRTVLFVSHNMDSVQKLCKTGVLLTKGSVEYRGDIVSTIAKYQEIFVEKNGPIWQNELDESFGDISFESLKLINGSGDLINSPIKDGDELYVQLEFNLNKLMPDLSLGVNVFNESGKNIYRTLGLDLDIDFYKKMHVGHNVIQAKLPTDFLRSGKYNVVLDASRHNNGWIVNPYADSVHVVAFMKDQSTVFTPLHSTAAYIAPAIEWSFN